MTLSRIPTQLVAFVLPAPLLSYLGHAVEAGDRATFRPLHQTAGGCVAVVGGLLYIVAFAVLGPWVLSVYVGPEYELGVPYPSWSWPRPAARLAVVQQASLAALDRWRSIALTWVFGTAAFVLVLALDIDTLWRATIAPLAGVLTALAALTAMAGHQRQVLARGRPVVSPESSGAPSQPPPGSPHERPVQSHDIHVVGEVLDPVPVKDCEQQHATSARPRRRTVERMSDARVSCHRARHRPSMTQRLRAAPGLSDAAVMSTVLTGYTR